MALRIKKNLWIKPRICPDCHKFELFARHYLSERCRCCSQRNHSRLRKRHDHHKYGKTYQKWRRNMINSHPYCSLCGRTDGLTAHHIGGGYDLKKMTVLCNDCHQAYERWNNKGRPNARQKLVQEKLRILQVRLQGLIG